MMILYNIHKTQHSLTCCVTWNEIGDENEKENDNERVIESIWLNFTSDAAAATASYSRLYPFSK